MPCSLYLLVTDYQTNIRISSPNYKLLFKLSDWELSVNMIANYVNDGLLAYRRLESNFSKLPGSINY